MFARPIFHSMLLLGAISYASLATNTASYGEDSAVADRGVRSLPPIDMFDESRFFHEPSVLLVEAHSVLQEAEPRRFALADLEQLALQNSPTLAWAAARVLAAEGHAWQAGLPPNPTIGYLGEEMGDAGTAGQQGGFASQKFLLGGKLRYASAVAEEEVRQREQELAAWRYRVLGDVRSVFYEALTAQNRLELLEGLVLVGEQGVQAATELLKGGEVSRVDLLQAQIEANRVRVLADTARAQRLAAWRRLAAVAGVPHLVMGDLVGRLDEGIPELDWEVSLARTLQESPEIAVAMIRIDRAEFVVCRQIAERIPDINLQVSVQQDKNSGDSLTGVTVGMPLPLWNRNQGNIHRAQAELAAARRQAERVELSLQARLAKVFGRYSSARAEAERYAKDILPGAKDALDLVSEGYRRGELNYLALLTAQRTYSQASLTYIEALARLRASVVAIEAFMLSNNFGDGG